MTQHERREFVRTHRTAVFGYGRRHDGPSMTVIYYVMDGDDILVSTMAGRGKAKAVRRNPKVAFSTSSGLRPTSSSTAMAVSRRTSSRRST